MLYQADTVKRVVDISQHLLSQWLDRGHIQPTEKASGQGSRNLYSEENICQIQLFKELNEAGLSRSESSRLAFADQTRLYFNRTIARERRVNKLLDLRDPRRLVNVVFIRDHDGNVKTFYLETKRDYDSMYLQIIRSQMTHIANLTGVALRVMGALEELQEQE